MANGSFIFQMGVESRKGGLLEGFDVEDEGLVF